LSARVMLRPGSLDELLRDLQDIHIICGSRQMEGWAPFQDDERWRYDSMMDRRVCPVCNGYQVRRILTGDEMQREFRGKAEYLGGFHAKPNTHRAYPRLKGECRCDAYLVDPERTLALRLSDELQGAVT